MKIFHTWERIPLAVVVPALIAGMFFSHGVGLAHAQTAPTPVEPTDDCVAITPADLAELQAVQTDPTLTPAQELSQDLAIRKELLAKTIGCATQDAQALQASLAAVAWPADGGASVGVNSSAIQTQLSGKLTDTVDFYNLESGKLNGAGISATQAIAQEVLTWRSTNYTPLEAEMGNVTLWAENQALFETAENRLTQTQRVVAFIQSITTTNGGLETSLQAAQTSLAGAESENAAAGSALLDVEPADQSLALIQQSLQSLADAYQKFSDLNTQIQVLLPTSN